MSITHSIEFEEINKDVTKVVIVCECDDLQKLRIDKGTISKLGDSNVTWDGRTIEELETILAKMKELQSEVNK